MKSSSFYTITLFCLFISTFLSAQPATEFYGCHHARYKHLLTPLTEAQKLILQQADMRSDTIDILNYSIHLDVTNFTGKSIAAACEVTFTPKKDSLTILPLDLLKLTVDSVTWKDTAITFDYDDFLLLIYLPEALAAGDIATVTVHYHGSPTADPSGFGGFVFTPDHAYNLGIGLSSNPYNFGRSWFPCFDNFVERSTYEYHVVTNNDRRAYCVGTFLSETDLGNGKILRSYRMSQQIPTYLSGVAVGKYSVIDQVHQGRYGQIPIQLIGLSRDAGRLEPAFSQLGNAIDALESWFGPYVWERVGYVLTERGAMEHPTNIAYPSSSVGSGATPAQNRLMAHELAHHWWGNLTTLNSPSDMWIKEGNAEYGAHLFTELAFGKEYFKDVVKDNHGSVLARAHIEDDNQFLALSGIPYEYTYGYHTYNKGASMMHNLRGYLGDSLFSVGMRSILETYPYSAIDAFQFRDQLMLKTGADLIAFFEDWIFNPGYSGFELDSVHYENQGGHVRAKVYVQQKLRKAPHLHSNVPIDITFFDENWNTFTGSMTADGANSSAEIFVPFQPVLAILNDNNRLNLAQMQDRTVVRRTGAFQLSNVSMTQLNALAVPDSALLNVIHYWIPPDPPSPNPNNIKLSSTHYWNVDGIFPEGFEVSVMLSYTGNDSIFLDYDLVKNTEDSLILVYRPDAKSPWEEYPFYRKIPLSLTDGKGFIRIDKLLKGDYSFANGDFPSTSVRDESEADIYAAYPNPAEDYLQVSGWVDQPQSIEIQLFGIAGDLVYKERTGVFSDFFEHRVPVGQLPAGLYFLKMTNALGSTMKSFKIVIH